MTPAMIEQVRPPVPAEKLDHEIARLLDALQSVYDDGWYPELEVVRPWSTHNPRISGEFARPCAIRRYLHRELRGLLAAGATVTARAARPARAFTDPEFFAALDEDRFDLRVKKLFLFGPERMALSLDRLSHYTGTRPSPSSGTCCSPTTPCTSSRSWSASPTPSGPTAPGSRCPPTTTRAPTATA